MTSNIGSDVIRDNFSRMTDRDKEEVIEKTQNMVFEMLKQSVRPEFLNRIDEVIMFQPLSKKDVHAIVGLQLDQVKQTLVKQGIQLSVTPEAVDWLSDEGFNPEFGARPVKRVIQKKVLNELSKQILLGKIDQNEPVVLDVFDGVVVFRKAIKEEEVEA